MPRGDYDDDDLDCDDHDIDYDHEIDSDHEPMKDYAACDQECGYCGNCDY